MHRFKARVAGLLLLCSMLLVSTIFYFLIVFDVQSPKKFPSRVRKNPLIMFNFEEHKNNNDSLELQFERQIKRALVTALQKPYFDIDPQSDAILRTLKNTLQPSPEGPKSIPELLKASKSWIRARQIVPEQSPELGDILQTLRSSPILVSDVYRQGTQLKLLITMPDGLQAILKPQRYLRAEVTENSHSGNDRHNGEIISFHISRLLGLRSNPIVGSRVLNVEKEIKNCSTESLRKTFLEEEGQELCFYGECYYCNEFDPVCPSGVPGTEGMLEAALILLLPQQYKVEIIKNPWQRTYRPSLLAKWQTDAHYCLEVKKTVTDERLLDFIDSSIFDFIIGNSDRHHHQVWKDVQNSALLLIDNGKSFANPQLDELSILFPLLQCCQVRRNIYERLKYLSSYRSKDMLTYLLSDDILWPLLTDEHYEAIDRRIRIVLEAITLCSNTTKIIVKL